MRRFLSTLLVALPLAAAACLGEDPVAPALPIEEVEFASSLGVDLAASTESATGLWYRDQVVGEGAQPVSGDQVWVSYNGRFTNGQSFDSGEFPFLLNRFQVIAGFDEGVSTMRVGGQRQLIIPPRLGYGAQWDVRGVIPPNSWLVFDVTLDSIQTPTVE